MSLDFVWSWALAKFKDYVIRNWPTTAAGAIGALITLIPALAPFREAILTFTVALVGLLAKSSSTTGTTATDLAAKAASSPAPVTVQPRSGAIAVPRSQPQPVGVGEQGEEYDPFKVGGGSGG